MITELIKAFVIGICAALPAGPVLLMVIRKTLCRGRSAGIMTGFGSAVADTVYAAVGLFALVMIQGFVESHASLIMIVGGALIAAIGLNACLRSRSITLSLGGGGVGTLSLVGYSFQSLASVLSNPAALAVMTGLLAVAGFGSGELSAPHWAVLAAVFAGEFLYWIALVFAVSAFIRPREKTLRMMSRVAGLGICCFALVLMARGIMSI